MNEKVGFVVLHYMALDATANCVKSIVETQRGENFCIIVVNNGDERTEELEKLCHGASDDVVIINSKINNGFARGMNIGYCEAKYRQRCEFIVLLNNDTLMVQNDFSAQMIAEYQKKAYAAAGPKMLMPDGRTDSKSNPLRKDGLGLRLAFFKYMMTVAKYLTAFSDLDLKLLRWERRVDRATRRALTKDAGACPDGPNLTRLDNCVLHGCCIILSPQYVRRYDGLNPKTFLYVEEQILFVRILANSWTTAYLKNLSIIHVGDVATSMTVHSNREKRRFKYRHHFHSYQVLIIELLKDKWKRRCDRRDPGARQSPKDGLPGSE